MGASTVAEHVVVHATVVGAPALMLMLAEAVLAEIYCARRFELLPVGRGMTMLNVTATVCADGAFDVPLPGVAELPPPPPHDVDAASPITSARRAQTTCMFMNPPESSWRR
jgi:hypothetical protein